MKELGLAPKRRKKYRCTTNSKHKLPVAPNLLERNFDPERLNQVWVGDITEIQTKEGSLYFVGVKDLCSKRLTQWSLQDHMKADLVVTALKNALMNRSDIKGLIFHSDRGVQYASVEFRQVLWKHAINQSMSRKGDCWDNAPMESFFGSLKCECIYQGDFNTKQEAREAVFEYVESFYNRERLHAWVGYMTPTKFEDNWIDPKVA
jgi:transposase InsO family protein